MIKKRIVAGIFTTVFALTLAVPSVAAVKAKSISITGKKTVTVGKTIELDSKINPKNAGVADKNIIWTSNDPSVAKVMEKYDDDTKIKGVKAGTAVITVQIKGTDIKNTINVTVQKAKSSTATVSGDEKKLAAYLTRAKNLKKKIKKLEPAATKKGKLEQYSTYEKKIDAIERKIEKIEDRWENKWEKGKIKRSTWRSIEKKADKVEAYLDTVEEYLEAKLGIDD